MAEKKKIKSLFEIARDALTDRDEKAAAAAVEARNSRRVNPFLRMNLLLDILPHARSGTIPDHLGLDAASFPLTMSPKRVEPLNSTITRAS